MSDQIPRLSAKEMPPELASFLRPRIERLGYLGEFFQCTAHQPEALLSFLEFTEHLKHALPNRLTEVVALSVAVLMDNAYERVQHERLSLKLGFDEEWVREVLSLSADRDSFLSQQELVVQQLVISVATRGGRDTKSEFEAVTRAIGPAQAIAVLMLIGRYLSHALIVNTLNLAPPPIPSAQENNL
ncbi:MAG: carboxymuconolactone decarboxylase family protein [Acidobacteriaceae bacterium]